MLWKVWVKLDLIDRGLDSPHLFEFFEVGDGPVTNSDGSYLARSKDILHLSPRLAHIPVAVDRSSTIRVDREEFRAFILPVVSIGCLVHSSAVVGDIKRGANRDDSNQNQDWAEHLKGF